MSLLSTIPAFKGSAIENPSETRYLESHRQIAFPLKGNLQIFAYDLASNRYSLKQSIPVNETCDLIRPISNGFVQECDRSAKKWNLEVYTFSKSGKAEKRTPFKDLGSIGFARVGNRVLLRTTMQKKRMMIDTATREKIKIIDPDTQEESTVIEGKRASHIGSNLFLLGRTDVYELVANTLVFKEKLPEKVSSVSGKVIDERKNLFLFESIEKKDIIIATLPFKVVQRIPGDEANVISHYAILVKKGEEPEEDFIYTLRKGNPEGRAERRWEKTQTFSSFRSAFLYPTVDTTFVAFWNEGKSDEGRLMKWNPSTKTLDLVREGKLNLANDRMLSSHLVLHEEGKTEEDITPIISDVYAGEELQRFSLEGYGTSYEDIPPNPTEYVVLTEVIQAFIPCKKNACVVPKEVTGVIAKFL